MDGTLNSKFKSGIVTMMCLTMALLFCTITVSVFAEPPGLKVNVSQLRHKDVQERRKAARLLSRRKDKVAVSALAYTLGNDSDANVRALSACSLGKIRDKSVAGSLVAALKDDKLVVRIEAIRAIGEIGDKTVVYSLIPLLEDKNPHIRCEAAKSLGKLGEKRGLRILLKEAESEKSEVRIKAILALRDVGQKSPGVIKVLNRLLNDSNKRVSSAADLVLQYFGGR